MQLRYDTQILPYDNIGLRNALVGNSWEWAVVVNILTEFVLPYNFDTIGFYNREMLEKF